MSAITFAAAAILTIWVAGLSAATYPEAATLVATIFLVWLALGVVAVALLNVAKTLVSGRLGLFRWYRRLVRFNRRADQAAGVEDVRIRTTFRDFEDAA